MKGKGKYLTLLIPLVVMLSLLCGIVVFAADETEGVCTLNGTSYASLQDAIDYVQAGETATITLTSDVTVDSTITFSKANTITLSMNGYSISASENFDSSSNKLITITNGASVTIDGKGFSDENGSISGSCMYLLYVNTATLNIRNTTLDGNETAGRGITADGKGAVIATVDNCVIKGVTYGIEAYKCNPSGNTTAGIGTISNTTIDATEQGVSLYMSICQEIKDSSITGGNYGVLVNSNCGDGGYSTEVIITSSTVTGTNSYAVYMYDKNWSGTGTLKVTLSGCTLSGAGNVAIYAHNYMSNVLGEDYAVTYDEYTNIVCSEVLGWGNWIAYYTVHTPSDSVVTEPTCTEDGYTTYTCSVCGDTYVDDYIDAIGHDYDYANGVWTWTETDDGYTAIYTVTCNNDSSHTVSYEATVTSTEQEDGSIIYAAAVYVSDNDETYTDTYTVAVEDEEDGEDSDDDSVQTSDNGNIAMMGVILLMAIVGCAGVAVSKRR